MTHAVFDKKEGTRGVDGRSSRRQLLDLRSHSTPPSKVALRCGGRRRGRVAVRPCRTQRPRLASGRKPSADIGPFRTEGRPPAPRHYTPNRRLHEECRNHSLHAVLRGLDDSSPVIPSNVRRRIAASVTRIMQSLVPRRRYQAPSASSACRFWPHGFSADLSSLVLCLSPSIADRLCPGRCAAASSGRRHRHAQPIRFRLRTDDRSRARRHRARGQQAPMGGQSDARSIVRDRR